MSTPQPQEPDEATSPEFRCPECGSATLDTMNTTPPDYGEPCGKYSAEFNSWNSMRQRCQNTNNKEYADYGGRGISVCERWGESFALFFQDMGKCPDGHTLGRINNDGNYDPSNCRWETYLQQSLNRRSNIFITIAGETKTASQWADQVGIKRSIVYERIRYGWDKEKAVLTPPKNA